MSGMPEFRPARQAGSILYVSGQVPRHEGQLVATGIVGREVSIETARVCARRCALNILDVIEAQAGSLDAVAQVLKLTVFVAADPSFTAHPEVANEASRTFVERLGERGRHARSAVGVASLPLGVPVEIEAIVELAGE
jgi:enamine deaminase RidA (YjgF/YER057c/UK114 family)